MIRHRELDNPIIIVSGLPRSGTSMLMHMLSAAGVPLVVDGVRTADEDNPLGYYEFTPVKTLDRDRDKAWLAEARGKAIKIVSFFLPHLPEEYHYKILFIKRSLPEVLDSQKKMIQRRGESAGDVPDDQMAGIFAAHLTKVQNLLASRANCDVLYVEHRHAVEAPAQVAAAINDFLGGQLDTAAMTAVVDQQLHRNRA
jgi:hypothetical protein